ncbi:complex I NDUFA9 subunit family protein [Shimia abyssi]|uniref:NADH dehydrogenase n=1 Tax=Shimia abyssi TaxID=1662395 RepID=A0A2P8F4D3_9RHOB|nr:complex I NDUFA9 subunit family protein [Shimia abyssi]PSL16599.1 NADH dehydrogenase [Shimia abyssi]
MSKLVTIFGGSGFVGRHIAQRMAKQSWRVRVAVRRPNEAMFVKPYGTVGQVEPVFCNIRDDVSVSEALDGANAVVNCVGILANSGKNTFETVQAEGASRIARIATEKNIERLVHLSALGADAESESSYARTKAAGEAAILENFPTAMILRPSVIFGADDQFFNRFASMSRMGPILPIVGGETLFQPVYVDDVAKAAVKGVLGEASGRFELGGPQVNSLRGWVDDILEVINRNKIVLNLPFFVGRMMGWSFDIGCKMLFGLLDNKMLTRDQVKLLRHDNIVAEDAKGFEALGIQPIAPDAIIADYLWRFRPSGQYDAIKESAKNLKV